MATRKTAKGSEQKPAIEIIVEVPHGTKRAKVDRLIQAALRHVSTDILEAEEVMVVRVQHDGNGNGLLKKTITKKPSKKRA
jgi:hypothetical protein